MSSESNINSERQSEAETSETAENEFSWKIAITKNEIRVSFKKHLVLIERDEQGTYVLGVYSRDSGKRVFIRGLGKRNLDFTKIGSRQWKEMRQLIGVGDDQKEIFISEMIAAADRMADLTKEVAEPLTLTPEQREEAFATLQRDDLDDYVKGTLDKVIVGEDAAKQIGFHCYLSTYTGEPFSIKLEGASRGGKDAVAGKTLQIFPAEDVESFSAGVSKRAIEWLAATKKDEKYVLRLRNKVWYFPDMEVATSDILKVLLSEGKKERLVTLKEEGRLVTRKLVVEGKPACAFTTVVPMMGTQFENRLLKLDIDETKEQTKRVLAYKKKCHAGLAPLKLRRDKNFGDDPDALLISDAIRLLRDEGLKEVVVPYAQLVEYPVDVLRDRSDIDILFWLMGTHAFLHQLRRPILNEHIIVATLEDYEFAYDLIASFLIRARKGLVGRAGEVWEYIKDKEEATSKEISNNLPHLTQPRASQILKGFHELGLCTREKVSGYAGYYYYPKDVKNLKLSIKKEIEPQITPNFIKEWFLTKFKKIKPKIEIPNKDGKKQQKTLADLYISIKFGEKLKNDKLGQKQKTTPKEASNSFLIHNLTTLKSLVRTNRKFFKELLEASGVDQRMSKRKFKELCDKYDLNLLILAPAIPAQIKVDGNVVTVNKDRIRELIENTNNAEDEK